MSIFLNASAKAALAAYDAQATRRSIPLSSAVTYGNGGDDIDLPHAGVPNGLIVTFSGSLAVTNGSTVGTVTASPYWPFNIMGPSTLADYAGNSRIFADGFRLYQRDLLIQNAEDMKTPYSTEAYSSAIYKATIPSGVASSTVSAPVNFSVWVPISLHSNSALGSYAATVPKGTAQFQLKESTLTGPYINSPLTVSGSAKVALTGKWNIEYVYMDAPSNVPLPLQALAMIHEYYQSNVNTKQITAGGTPEEVLLTGREYYRCIMNLVTNNEDIMMNSAPPLANIQFLVDSSTPTVDWSLASYLWLNRREFGRDFPFILYNFFSAPWSPNAYGSLTQKLVLTNSITQGSYQQLVNTRETLYLPSGNLVKAGG